MTPLFLVVLTLAIIDVIFAVDSAALSAHDILFPVSEILSSSLMHTATSVTFTKTEVTAKISSVVGFHADVGAWQ